MKKIFQIGLVLVCLACNTKSNNVSKQIPISSNTLPYYNSKDFTPKWNVPRHKRHKIQNFQLIDQQGGKVNLNLFKNKIFIANFFFTSCNGICVKLMANIKMLQEHYKFNNRIKFLSHSVTPDIDTPTILNKYAKEKGVNYNQWYLVTAAKNHIYNLARDSYFSDEDYNKTKKKSTFIHSENFLLIDPNGHIRGVYNGTNTDDMQLIKKHIKILEKEFY